MPKRNYNSKKKRAWRNRDWTSYTHTPSPAPAKKEITKLEWFIVIGIAVWVAVIITISILFKNG
jgi:hypothetical protein